MTIQATQGDFTTRIPTTRHYLMCRPTYFDVVYEIKYRNTISMEERAKLTSEIATKLDLDVHEGANDKVSGSQLFFGIRLSPNPIVMHSASGEINPCTRR